MLCVEEYIFYHLCNKKCIIERLKEESEKVLEGRREYYFTFLTLHFFN